MSFDVEATFLNHLAIVEGTFIPSYNNISIWIYGCLFMKSILVWSMSLFSSCVLWRSTIIHVDLHPSQFGTPTNKMWGWWGFNGNVVHILSKYIKLEKLTILMVFDNVEDGETISIVDFIKSKLLNWLTTNLDLVVYMYT